MNLQFRFPVLASKCLLTIACFSFVGFLSGNVDSLFAQGASELTAVYGRGVHAFFGCDVTRAEQLFSEVIMAGTRDPRVYYFRGLAYLHQGREYEAESDFRMGAALEARDPGQRYAIGTALQRIQGPNRQTLERFRREGRLEKYQERRGQNQLRYEHLRDRESDVLHQDDPVLMEDLVIPSVERPVIRDENRIVPDLNESGTTSPVPSTPAAPAPEPKSIPAPSAPVVTPEDDPFGSAPAKQPAVDEEDPFGAPVKSEPKPAPAAEPESDDLFSPVDEPAASEAPTPQPAAPAEDDLFSDPAPARTEPAPATEDPAPAEDLFGSEPESEAAPAEPADEDPFGSAVDPSPSPEATEPAADPAGDDPFGASESAEEEMSDDPFGATGDSATDTPFGEPTPDEATLDEEVAHDEDAEAAADMEAAEEAGDVGAFVEDPVVGDDPFGEAEEGDTATEQPPEDAPPTDDSQPSEDTSSEDTADEGAEGEGEMTDESPAEDSTEDEDPFGGF